MTILIILFFYQLLTNTAKDPKIADVLSKYEFHVLPVFNADGYVYTHASKDTRLWRKTRSKTGYQCFGVDPNRNWNTKFAGSVFECPARLSVGDLGFLSFTLDTLRENCLYFQKANFVTFLNSYIFISSCLIYLQFSF